MTLREFIRATAKDVQDASTKKAVLTKQPRPQRTEPDASVAGTGGVGKDETEKEEPTPSRKNTKRGDQTNPEQDAVSERRRKEKVKKIKHEKGRKTRRR